MSETNYCKDCLNMSCPEGRVNCIHQDAIACHLYTNTPPTVFEKIIASKEALARALCGKVRVGCFGVYYSMLTGVYYPDTEKAVADTLKKLDEVG